MNVSVRRFANALVLRIEGRLDQDTCDAFRTDLMSHVEKSAHSGGAIVVGEARFDLEPHDVVVVPGWMAYTMDAAEDFVLFSYSDRAAQEKLGFFREQRLAQ